MLQKQKIRFYSGIFLASSSSKLIPLFTLLLSIGLLLSCRKCLPNCFSFFFLKLCITGNERLTRTEKCPTICFWPFGFSAFLLFCFLFEKCLSNFFLPLSYISFFFQLCIYRHTVSPRLKNLFVSNIDFNSLFTSNNNTLK